MYGPLLLNTSSSCKEVESEEEQLLWMNAVHLLIFSSRNSMLLRNFLPVKHENSLLILKLVKFFSFQIEFKLSKYIHIRTTFQDIIKIRIFIVINGGKKRRADFDKII